MSPSKLRGVLITLALVMGLLVPLFLLVSCASSPNEPAPTSTAVATAAEVAAATLAPATATALPAPTAVESQPTPTTAAASAGSSTVHDLIVVLYSQTGASKPESEAEIAIFSDGLLYSQGHTESGIFTQKVPAGTCDILMVYPSRPVFGYLKKDVQISGEPAQALVLNVPPEGDLKVVLRTKSDQELGGSAGITIRTGEEDVYSSSWLDEVRLRTDRTYTVTVTYGDETFVQGDVTVQEGQQQELKLALPYDEAALNVLVRSGGKPLTDTADISIANGQGKTVAEDSWGVSDSFKATLHAGETYTVTVKHGDQPMQQQTVTMEGTAGREITFDLTPRQ